MKMSMYLCLAVLVSLAIGANGQNRYGYRALDRFQSIGTSGAATTGRIQTSSNGSYSFEWVGATDLSGQFITRVAQESLAISMVNEDKSVYANVTGYYVVSVPAGSLSRLRAYGNNTVNQTGDTVNRTSGKFSATKRSGGQAYLTNFTGVALELEGYNDGDLIVSGLLQNVTYYSTGSGGLYLNGAAETVTLNLMGSSPVKINATGDIVISGTSNGTAKVYYNRGSCMLTNANGPATACQAPTTSLAIPAAMVPATSQLTTAAQG